MKRNRKPVLIFISFLSNNIPRKVKMDSYERQDISCLGSREKIKSLIKKIENLHVDYQPSPEIVSNLNKFMKSTKGKK